MVVDASHGKPSLPRQRHEHLVVFLMRLSPLSRARAEVGLSGYGAKNNVAFDLENESIVFTAITIAYQLTRKIRHGRARPPIFSLSAGVGPIRIEF